ncbi:hypothetical protein AWENTII_007628 [Aspergillus wentii]
MSHREDPLAYGQYNQDRGSGNGDSARGLVGDTFKKLRSSYKNHQQAGQQSGQQTGQNQNQNQQQTYNPSGYGSQTQGSSQQQPPYQTPQYQGKPQKADKVSGILGKLQGVVAEYGNDVAHKLGTALDPQAYAEYGQKPQTEHRFGSFAPSREGNDVKWYVDGCSYFYAVSKALESAKDTIWILDWWLSPELYLRRPPAKNEQYRLDRMLLAAAQRGVRVNIIVYKEVEQALTLSSSHTKKALEDLHPNIAVFRHPDHLPTGHDVAETIESSFKNLTLNAAGLSKLPGDALKSLYGINDDVILYWAHHEKLCLIDGKTAFMGGLDLCFGRWDTNQHAISDAHPAKLDEIVFPGQDYNNARVLDFQDVAQWEKNQLSRKETSRMGWSDISMSLHGQVVEDLRRHFVERWNFIYDSKYQARNIEKYSRLALYGRPNSAISQGSTSSQPTPYQKPASVTQQQQEQPQQQQPQWQAQQPQAQAQQKQQEQPSWQQQAQPQQAQPQQAQQQPNEFHNKPGAVSAYPPAPSTDSQGPPSYEESQPHVASQPPQGAPHYTYTGDSFPPPPPGPPPSQSPVQNQNQAQGHAQNQAPYFPPPPTQSPTQNQTQGQNQAPYYPPPPGQEAHHSQTRGVGEHHEGTRGFGDLERGLGGRFKEFSQYGTSLRGQLAGQIHQYQDRLTSYGQPNPQPRGTMACQIVRSCAKWSHGSDTEHSIQDAYAAIIRNSEHFIYIENQFFITATSDAQKPVMNKIGSAIVERILRAAKAGQKYKMVIVIPSVPCFAGDLSDESTLGTRAIMEFQYNSINRGGNSIMELIAKEGYNPMEYIRFYNLRNYDRINFSSTMTEAEQRSGVNYEDARRQQDVNTSGPGGYGPGAPRTAFDTSAPFQKYQQAANQVSGSGPLASGRWDSVSECYMLNGEDIRNVPWEGPPEAEIDAFVTEELYVHSKVMVADDRIVICGSANLNDRSQLGDHDSEIAVIVEDHSPIQSKMNGKPWVASRFASSLRRQLFRKHLGLLPPQDYRQPDANFEPVGVPNKVDFDSPESQIVADPLADTLYSLWNTRARTNTEVFRKVFHSVPDDTIRNWATYKEFYGYYFNNADDQAHGKGCFERQSRYKYGHVVRDDFPQGPEGVKQVKELLSQVKGTLVEMPLMFLIEEDVAKEGLALNDLTEPIYT